MLHVLLCRRHGRCHGRHHGRRHGRFAARIRRARIRQTRRRIRQARRNRRRRGPQAVRRRRPRAYRRRRRTRQERRTRLDLNRLRRTGGDPGAGPSTAVAPEPSPVPDLRAPSPDLRVPSPVPRPLQPPRSITPVDDLIPAVSFRSSEEEEEDPEIEYYLTDSDEPVPPHVGVYSFTSSSSSDGIAVVTGSPDAPPLDAPAPSTSLNFGPSGRLIRSLAPHLFRPNPGRQPGAWDPAKIFGPDHRP